jgi:iron complex transport system permease protein
LLCVTVLFSLLFGAASLAPAELLHSAIFLQVRLPRVVACLLCGAALAVSGLLAQTRLSNPLASPTLLGVNSGAGFLLALGNVLLGSGKALLRVSPQILPVFAFAGALGASLLIFLVSLRRGSRRGTLLLAGVAISSILSAGIDTLHTLFPQALPGYNSFMLGSFAASGWSRIGPTWIYIALGLAAALLLGGALDVFALGDETAQTLGMRVNRTRGAALLIASVLAGAAVSICGLLSFVGLICPHLARAILRTGRHRALLPASLLLGATLVTLCDTLSRTLFAPYELPAGIALSFVGGPFFLYLLLRKKRVTG